MKIGSKVIVPHVTLLFSETGRKLTLEVATVREHIQTDGWTNPAQDYDYDIRLSNGKRYHTFDVYDIPEGVNPTPEMLAAIANECPPDVLEPSRVTNLRTYVWKALAACKPHPTVASLLADVQGDQRSVTAIVGKDEVNLYRDEACKHRSLKPQRENPSGIPGGSAEGPSFQCPERFLAPGEIPRGRC